MNLSHLGGLQKAFLRSHFGYFILNYSRCQSRGQLHFLAILFVFSTPQITPRHICRQVINVTLLHQRIIKCQVLPWQQNVMAESQWRGGGVVRVKESPGGRACWEGSMAHLTPACPLLNQARPLTPFTHSLPGNEVVQLLRDECAQPDATTCGDLLMYYKEDWWQNEESRLSLSLPHYMLLFYVIRLNALSGKLFSRESKTD